MKEYKSDYYENQFPNLKKTALLIIDAQERFRHELFGIKDNINYLADSYRKKGNPIIWLQHIQGRASVKNTMYRGSPHLSMTKGDDCTNFCSIINCEEGEPIIIKSEYDAFYKTELDPSLKQQGILELVLVGPMINLSCDFTARTAVILGYKVHIVSDATTARNEHLQHAALTTLANSFAYVHSAVELVQHAERSKVCYSKL